ncbi:MAG TPA: sugar kinase [Terriglobales bacterium]|nr:sugar kinase [Terriglobales bacterium]
MPTSLPIRPASECRWDLVALGEVMLRFDPGDRRIANARHFEVSEGGGEYNVARGLARCFGLRTALVTALVENPLGRLVEDLIRQGGVDAAHLAWLPHDGVGRAARNGLYFAERGFGLRPALATMDRGHSAASQMLPGAVNWDEIFGVQGARWFHTGGIFCALSASTAAVAEEAMRAAKRHGVVVSYDLNYRESLWKALGGRARAREVNRALAPLVDVMLGNEEDFSAALGFEVPGLDAGHTQLPTQGFEQMIRAAVREFPFQIVATTLRRAHTASRNDWCAIAYGNGGFVHARERRDLEIFDRIGGGDSFASGLIYGLLAGRDLAWAVECGAAHGALAMTTPGDTTMATLEEVLQVMRGASARIAR